MPTPMLNLTAVSASCAESRISHADRWLDAHGASRQVVIVATTVHAGAALLARATDRLGGTFGWVPTTLLRLAATIANPILAERGVQVGSALALEAVCASAVRLAAKEGALGHFEPIAYFPGLPRAVLTTLCELRMAGVGADDTLAPPLARLMALYEQELSAAALCDRAELLREATAQLDAGRGAAVTGRPVLTLDVKLGTRREQALVTALFARATAALMTIPRGDAPTARAATELGATMIELASEGPLAAVQDQLFSSDPQSRAAVGAVTLLSAPGESRECVEIARAILHEARHGAAYDRIAVAVHAGTAYAPHLTEAFRRAGIPAFFSDGTTEPNSGGRAVLTLLACAAEGCSALRFSEFLSLDAHRFDAEASAPATRPTATSVDAGTRAAPVEDTLPDPVDASAVTATAGRAATARKWESIVLEAKVIGGRDRFRGRLERHAAALSEALARLPSRDVQASERLTRDAELTAGLIAFALPIIDALAALPSQASWGEWSDAIASLARRALAEPSQVLSALGDFEPMRALGPVTLAQVTLALTPRLSFAPSSGSPKRGGCVFVASPDDLRGLAFDVVFVPGLAERVFPKKIAQDALLMDDARLALGVGLPTNVDRSEQERLALRLAVGAARLRAVATYPRLDAAEGRPRTPSFYALDLVRAAEGVLPGYADVAQRASEAAGARIGWPAPSDASRAIDDAEYDLATLDGVLRLPAAETVGAARYLLTSNVHLARALRARWMRWDSKKWEVADGLVSPAPEAIAALAAHQLTARSFSPTALQTFAACPYRFLLHTVLRLSKREEPDAQLELNAMEKGSLMHETLYDTLVALRAEGLLPVTAARHDRAREVLESCLETVAARYFEEVSPLIARVWDDTRAAIKADLAEWLRRMELPDEAVWVPTHFELSFGLKDGRSQQDATSVDSDLALRCGVRFRGSIDLVEQRADGALRATDFKSGKVRATATTIIGGGKTLQPALYALALAEHFPGRPMISARLYYCTSTGDYQSFPERPEQFDLAVAEREASLVVSAVGEALRDGFLPAAPAARECEWCDFKPVCGPYEEQRTRHKPKDKLSKLLAVRSRP